MKNNFKLVFPSFSQNEAFARAAVCAFVSQYDPTICEFNDIRSVVSEAVTNAIVHGYRDFIGNVEITATIDEKRVLYIRIKDKGIGIPDIEQAMQPLYTTCTEGERAGLGFAVMEAFTDKMKVRSDVGKGTTVTLIKNLSSKSR